MIMQGDILDRSLTDIPLFFIFSAWQFGNETTEISYALLHQQNVTSKP